MGSIIGVIKGDARSLDYSSYVDTQIHEDSPSHVSGERRLCINAVLFCLHQSNF